MQMYLRLRVKRRLLLLSKQSCCQLDRQHLRLERILVPGGPVVEDNLLDAILIGIGRSRLLNRAEEIDQNSAFAATAVAAPSIGMAR
jgi:hypothetical protein